MARKLIALVVVAVLSAAAGCSSGKEKEQPRKNGQDNVIEKRRTLNRDYEEYQKNRYETVNRSKGAKEGMDLLMVREAVQKYRAENGRFPDKLNDLEGLVYSEVNLDMFDYDARSGRVSPKTGH